MNKETIKISLLSQKLAQNLYTAVERGLLDGAKVKQVLKITREDAFEGRDKSKSYRSVIMNAGIVTNLLGDQSILRPVLITIPVN